MATTEDKTFFKKLEENTVKWVVGFGLTSLTALVTFYFTTTATLQAHEKTTTKNTERLDKVEQLLVKIASNPELTSVQIGNIVNTLEDIKERQIKYEENQTKANDRMDKLYDEVIKLLRDRH